MAGNVVVVTDATFKEEILDSDIPALVDFWAGWCAPCHMVSPIVEEIAKQYAGRLKTGKFNVDENPETATKYNIMSIPTLLFFKNGEVVDQIIGVRSKTEIQRVVENVIG